MHRILATTSAVVLAAACRAAAPADHAAIGVTRDSAGIAIVEYRGEPARSTITVDPTPLLVLGAPGGADTAIQFSFVRAATRLSDGTVVVMDATDETRWFDSTGHHLRTTTRKGDGPGEFRYTESLFRVTGDSVVVSGGPEGHIKQATFAPNGTLAHEDVLDFERYRKLGRFGECRDQTLPDRSRLACLSIPLPDPTRRGPDPGPGYLRRMSRFVRVPVSLDRVYQLGLDGGIVQTGVTIGERTEFVVHPFAPWSVVAAGGAPMRIVIATGPAYEIEVWNDTGTLERIIRRLDGRVPLTGEDRAEHERLLREGQGQMGPKPDPATLDKIVKAVPPPDSMPGIGGIVVGPQGTLFVSRVARPLGKSRFSPVDVFDAGGRFIATLALPPRFRILEAGADYLLGARYDADDVPFVETYRLRVAPIAGR